MEEMQKKLLHGTLEITVFDATPYSPPFPFNCIFRRPKPAYVTIKINKKRVAKTSPECDRVWNQTFQILCAHPASETTITIALKTNCSVLGKLQFTAEQILTANEALTTGLYPLVAQNRRKPNPNPNLKLKLMMWFKPAYLEPCWSKVIGNNYNGQLFQGIKNASFPQRSNCRVVLYQDAHHRASFNPRISGVSWTARKLWEDVYTAIDGARHLVYIAGWALNPNMVLVRDPETEIPLAIGVTIGELLKRKAEDGVAVRILLWNDETSLPLIRNKGVMRTNDETAFSYFRNSKVVCRLCDRAHGKLPTAFAHHQKTITADTRVSATNSHERELISFVGGLDLCDGRYDTEEHSVFRTLNAEPDFYQTSVSGAKLSRGGPREPWHDCHASVIGEAAWDVLKNFEQRWTKQCDPSLLVNVSAIRNLVVVADRSCNNQQTTTENEGAWNVQVLRSIDHVSATEMPRGLPVESSVHSAYVEAIRRAERFIYIENQYFMGSCDHWHNKNDLCACGCTNLIPVEIALKIASKIRAKERFAVYVVVPMWPEGFPESESVEEMLQWTRETMKTMYRIIGEAMRDAGDYESHPRDYLNFFCLANREEKGAGEFEPCSSPRPNTHYSNAQRHRRFMVYVHSKLMIVDDAYALIGSANINQRSMDGRRDTEIAIGCYQPRLQNDYNCDNDYSSDDIRAYRLSLWYEHIGGGCITADELASWDPASPECVRGMRTMGERMWEMYRREEVVDMGGVHLAAYPISVTRDGIVEDVPDGVFPDTKMAVKGRQSKMLPPVLTT